MTQTAADEHAVSAGYRYDEASGDRAVTFFERFLRHSKGRWAGQPFVLLDWQRDRLIRPLFGWLDEHGRRRFKSGYVEIPKKNGKSSLCSGIAIYLLLGDEEPGAEVYCAAADRDQAGLVFRESANMIRQSPELSRRLKIIASTNRIVDEGTFSFLKTISREAYSAEGMNIHGLIFDELHAQRDRALWDALRYGGAARDQPLNLSITTAGHDRNSICWEQRCFSEDVIEGRVKAPTHLGLIYAAAPDDDWTSEEVWRKANPSLGETIRVEDMRAACDEAKASPAKEAGFKRYRLNIWGQQVTRWLSTERWDACGTDFDAADLEGEPCFAALDLSLTTDLTALALVFPQNGWKIVMKYYAPEEGVVQREHKDHVPYQLWGAEGRLQLTPGTVVDYEFVRSDIMAASEMYDVRSLAVDPWNAVKLSTEMQDDGIPVAKFRQGYASMSPAAKEFERLVISGDIDHGNCPVLRWMAGNAVVSMDPAGNIKPNKAKSMNRIDGLVAAVMAVGVACASGMESGSVYEGRGMVVL